MDPLDDIYREIRDIRRRLRDLEALDRRDVPESSLAPHNHTAVEGDGGPLTNDEHDGYSEYAAIASPDPPAAGKIRAYGVDDDGTFKMAYKRPDGVEVLLAEAGSGAPSDAAYLVEAAHAGLSNETLLATAIARSTWAARAAAAVGGRIQLYSDAPYLGRDNGASIDLYGPIWPLTPPTLADFTWSNQGTATATDANGLIYLSTPAGSGANLRILYRTAPTPPYSFTIAMLPQLRAVNFAKCGLGWMQDDDKCVVFGLEYSTGPKFCVHKYSASNSYGSAYVETEIAQPLPLFWRITDDGTNRICSMSRDGLNFDAVHSIARKDFITPTRMLLFVEANNATNPAAASFLSAVVS